MFDYPAIQALAAVIEAQSFEAAASKLFVTQSAVSQRIKSLENYYGEPVLVRTHPYRPTKLGEILLGHYKKVMLLEDHVISELSSDIRTQRITIALSRDSLETWFVEVIEQLENILPITLEIIADDQEITNEYLRKGIVAACVSTSPKAISGVKAEFIGYFDYVLAASPSFKQKYFDNKKNTHQNLITAPTMNFDSKDDLQARYLKHFFNIDEQGLNYHVVPSVAGFRQFTLKGYAYALIPKIQILKELKQKKLINLFPDKIWEMPLYWHSWNFETKTYKDLNELVFKVARKYLRQDN